MIADLISVAARMLGRSRLVACALLCIGIHASALASDVSYVYDDRGRLTRAEYDPPNGPIVNYGYDDNGNRTGVTTSNVTRGILSLTASSYSGGEATGSRIVTVSVQRTGGSYGSASVSYATVNGGAVASGTTGDFLATSGSLTWGHAEAATKSFTITILDDTAIETSESFSVVLSAFQGVGSTNPTTASISIVDNDVDATPPGAPGNPTFTSITGTSATASWTAASDAVGVTGYQYRLNSGSWQTLGNVLSVSLSGLTNATSYTVNVRGRDGAGNWGAFSSNTFVTRDTAAPSTPTGLAISVVSSTQLNLSWTASTDNAAVTGYDVERCTGANCTTFAQIATSTTTTYNDGGLTASTSYTYRVRARDAANNLSAFSSTATGTPTAGSTADLVAAYSFDAGAGTMLADASGNGNTGTLTNGPVWTSGTTSGALAFDGADDFVAVPTFDVPGSALTIMSWVRFSNFAAGVDQRIVAKANGSDEAGHWWMLSHTNTGSERLRFRLKTGGTTTTLIASSGDLASNTWYHAAAVYDGAAMRLYLNGTQVGITAKSGSIDTSSAVAVNIGRNPNSFGYLSGALDDIRIYRRALSATEIASDMTTPVGGGSSGDTQAPSTPSGLTATATSSAQINLSWTGSTDTGGSGLTGYKVERCQGVGCTNFSQITTGAGTTYSDTGHSPVTTYVYRVRAYDGAGNNSGYTASVSATTLADTTAPSVPASISAVAISSTQLNVSWAASSDTGSGLAGYKLERCQGAGCTSFTEITSTTATSFSDSSLASSTTYVYRVRAYDVAGNHSGYSPSGSGATQADTQAPSTPASLTATAASPSQINLSWSASTDSGGSGLTGYKIERCTGGGCTSFSQIATISALSYSNTALSDVTTYGYRVRAYDAAGNHSGYSISAAASTPDGTAPSAPGTPGFSGITANAATAFWSAASDNVAVTAYEYSLNGSAWASNGTSTTRSLTGLTNATPYTLQVRARDAAAYTSTVASNSFTTLDNAPPTAPGTPSFSAISFTTATASWSAAWDNVGVTGYQYRLNGGAWQQVGNVTSLGLTGLAAATTYTFELQARDAAGNWSSVVSNSFSTALPTITLPASYSFSSGGTAQFWLEADGDLWHNMSGGIGQDFGDWLSPKTGMSSLEVLATAQGGTGCGGSFNVWLPMTNDRSWYSRNTGPSGTTKYCQVLLQIRRIGTTTVLGTGTIHASAWAP
jgi:YD repeat-containing protein